MREYLIKPKDSGKVKALDKYTDTNEVYLGTGIKEKNTLVPEGKGIKKFSDGSIYFGEFVNG